MSRPGDPIAGEGPGEAARASRATRASEARRTSGRRRRVDPVGCDIDYTPDQVEFMRAMDEYRRRHRRPFPTWSEALEVLRGLGYRKVESRGEPG